MSDSEPTEQERALGRALRRARRDAGLTQRALAQALGMTQPHISGIEQGKVTRSSVIVRWLEICRAYWGVTSARGTAIRSEISGGPLTQRLHGVEDALTADERIILDVQLRLIEARIVGDGTMD